MTGGPGFGKTTIVKAILRILAAKDVGLLLCADGRLMGPTAGPRIIRMSLPQPEPLAQEVLAGLVERVTYHNAENGFCVLRARARGHRDVVTVVGHVATISAGE
jgi:nucleoside-triphosphatase THEP1